MDCKATTETKRQEAKELMTKDQIRKCNVAIHTAAIASGVIAWIPIVVVDAVPITAAQVTMVIALGKVFNRKITESVAKSLLATTAATFVGRNLVKFIPIVGWAISSSVAAGITEAVGWTIAVDMANMSQKEQEYQSNVEDA